MRTRSHHEDKELITESLLKFIAEVNEAELMCRLIESASDGKFKRPFGISAAQAILCLEEQDQSKWRRVARTVMGYYRECVENAQRVQ